MENPILSTVPYRSVVTGSMGFLGTAICKFLDNPIKFDVLSGGDLDIATPKDLARLWAGVTEIYHCAGVVGTSELEENAILAFEQNFMNTLKVFEAAKLLGAQVFFPSKPLSQKNIYTSTKRVVEEVCKDHYPDVKILTIFNLFGPNQPLFPVRRMLPNFILRAIKRLPIQLYGDGSQYVDMLYVEDAAKIIIWHMRKCGCIKYDLGGHQMTVKQVAEDVNEMLKNPAGIEYLPMRLGEDASKSVVSNFDIHVHTQIRLTPWRDALFFTVDEYEQLPKSVLKEALTFYNIQ